jgi:aryl-alcohol dehydrogenase-like predicted oxidoreductase
MNATNDPVSHRHLGSSELTISPVGVGAFAIGGWMWGGQDDAESERALLAALDTGINWIDTAPIYGEGKASLVVGRVLKKLPSSRRPLVFTKFGHHFINGQRITDGSAAQVERDCDEELARLGTECIDLFQLHWPAPQPIQETASACAKLLKAGKIRAVGVSNFSAVQLAEWKATGFPLHSVQNGFSLVKPEPSEAVLPWCCENGVGLLAYSPLFRGLLSGTWAADKSFPPGDHRGERDDFRGTHLRRWLAAVEELRALGAEVGLTVPQLAVSRLLCNAGVAGVIVGGRNAAQGAALRGLAVVLRPEQIAAIDAIAERCRHDLGL